MLVLGALGAVAQEALKTARDDDRSVQARELIRANETRRLKIGPWEGSMRLLYEGEFNDNVRATEVHRENDFVQRPQLDFHGFLPVTTKGQLSLGLGVGYSKYLSHAELDGLFLSPDSEIAYDVSVKDLKFTFYDRFIYSREVETVGALSGVAQFPRAENTVGTRVTWVPSRWTYQLGYSHFNFISEGQDFNHLNRSSEQFLARVAYGLAPATQIGAEFSVALSGYTGQTQADNDGYSVGPYAEWKITETLSLSIRSGLTYYSFDSLPATPTTPRVSAYNLQTYYSGLEVNHRLTDSILHGLSFAHEIRPGINQGSDYLESTEASYRASWVLTRNTTLGAKLLFEHGIEQRRGLFGSTTEEYERFGGGVSGSYKLSKRITLTGAFNYLRRTSNEAGRNYFQSRASLALGYQF